MPSIDILFSWFEKNKAFLVESCTEVQFRNSGRGSAQLKFETESYRAEVCVWDHAFCLDIQVIEIRSQENIYPHIVSPPSTNGLGSHLDEFMIWFKTINANGATC